MREILNLLDDYEMFLDENPIGIDWKSREHFETKRLTWLKGKIMGYKDENIKHRLGINTPKPKYVCPHCSGKINVKASLVTCPSCKKVVDGDLL